MINDFHFIINDKDGTFELWVNGECITDCFFLADKEAELMEQLVRFANVPCYKKISFEEVHKILLDN
jgi:hypothetical protein